MGGAVADLPFVVGFHSDVVMTVPPGDSDTKRLSFNFP
jgi:hypothetical protein